MHITRLNSSWIEKMSNLAISVFDKQESVYYQDKKFYDGIVSFLNNCSIKNMLIQFLNNKIITFGAIDNNNLIGFISYNSEGLIKYFYVLEEYQNKGIGRKLLNSLFTYLNTEQILIDKLSAESTHYAVDIFKKLGFKQVGSEKINSFGIIYIPFIYKIPA